MGRKKGLREQRTCLYCGIVFEVKLISKKKYCSCKCSSKKQFEDPKQHHIRSERMKKIYEDPEQRKILSERTISYFSREDSHFKASMGQKNRYKNLEQRKINSEVHKKYYREHPEHSKKSSEKMKLFYQKHPERRQKVSIDVRKRFENPEYVKKLLRRNDESRAEKKFKEIIEENGFPFLFNGNAQNKKPLIINRKVPDFVHKTKPKLIEIWGNYWHKGQNPQDRIDYFKQCGYECIVFWASELSDYDAVVIKVKKFVNKEEE